MVVVSYSGKEINAKLVYYGPGLSGKTTNLEYIYQSVPSTNRGKMVSMKTRTERTLFFDFLPIDLGDIGGFKTRFLLYTVPGQVYYNATRKLVLRGVDAVIFVADSGRGKMEENIESLQNLRENLREYGLSLDEMPWVIQYNKRDLPDAYSIEELEAALNPGGTPYYEAVATGGQGVFEAFRGIAKLLLNKLGKEIKLGAGTRPASAARAEEAPASGPAAGPPPGLMSGGPSSRGYRPPAQASPTPNPSGVHPRPANLPGPQRPLAPPVSKRAAPPAGTAAGAPSRGGYRPPVPGQESEAHTAGAAPGFSAPRPRAPEPPRKSTPPPKPVQPSAGAEWFGQESPTQPMERPAAVPGPDEDAFSPNLELDTPQPAPFTRPGPDAITPDDEWTQAAAMDGEDRSDLESDYGTEDAIEEGLETPGPEMDHRVETLARRLHEESEAEGEDFEPDEEEEEDSPGFWGRLFRRRKEREEPIEYRRFPSRLDAPATSQPVAAPSPRRPEAPAPAPVSPEPPSRSLETVPGSATMDLHVGGAEDEAPAWEDAAYPSEPLEPVVLERTLQVPLVLSPEELRRGARLRLTLEVQIEPAAGSGEEAGLEDTEAA